MSHALTASLRQGEVLHLQADVGHRRRGAKPHAFHYKVDYVLLAPELAQGARGVLRRNRFGLFALHDADHGGKRGAGEGADWAWAQCAAAGITRTPHMIMALMTQPRFLGFGFNPVSFWCLFDGSALRAVIAEVNNTFGDRHNYLCHLDGQDLTQADVVSARKIFHVSPFQDVAGEYRFRFALDAARITIHIVYENGAEGLIATLNGVPEPLRQGRLLRAALTRPGGALRVVALIYWQALRLKLRGIAYRPRPAPPLKDISR